MNFKSYIHIDLLKHKKKRLCRNKTETPASHVGYWHPLIFPFVFSVSSQTNSFTLPAFIHNLTYSYKCKMHLPRTYRFTEWSYLSALKAWKLKGIKQLEMEKIWQEESTTVTTDTSMRNLCLLRHKTNINIWLSKHLATF